VTLGILTVLLRKPADVASAHVAVGALILVTTFTLAVRAWRLSHLSTASETEAFPTERANVHTIQRDPVLAA
jgi:heme A synthase